MRAAESERNAKEKPRENTIDCNVCKYVYGTYIQALLSIVNVRKHSIFLLLHQIQFDTSNNISNWRTKILKAEGIL